MCSYFVLVNMCFLYKVSSQEPNPWFELFFVVRPRSRSSSRGSSAAWNTCIQPNVTNKRRNWPLGNLDIVDTWTPNAIFIFYTLHEWAQDVRWQEWGECVFYAAELRAVGFNLGFTSDIVAPWLSSYSARFMEWDSGVFSLWLAGLRPAMHKVL